LPDQTVDVVVVGRDALGVDVCRRLKSAGRQVGAIWPEGASNVDEIRQLGIPLALGDARRAVTLSAAFAGTARTLVAVTNDDQFNIRVALAARDVDANIRVVIRQFNRRLGQKIAYQLKNCEAVSPETHSAATYAASCLNRWVYHALEFPRYSEELVVFCRGRAAELGAADATVADLRQRRGWHALAVDGQRFPPGTVVIPASAMVTIACRLEAAPGGPSTQPSVQAAAAASPIQFERPRSGIAHALRRIRLDPIFFGLAGSMIALVTFATLFFHTAAGLPWLEALYHVANSVTTTGADSAALAPTDATRIVEMMLMIGGISIVGVLLAYITAAITRRSLELEQGRHRVHGAGHVIVCGFGNVGSRVVLYLLHRDKRVTVIDRQPDATLSADVRARGAHVMTADATSESALEMASVRRAAGLLALTDSDSANIEIALTAGAYAPDMPVIMRIADPSTAQAAERHFRIRASYSAAALAAPLVAGLALESGSCGTVDIDGSSYPLIQRPRSAEPAGADEIILASDDRFVLIVRRSS
jgi:Trk K+ transport system NAD-binding subunit